MDTDVGAAKVSGWFVAYVRVRLLNTEGTENFTKVTKD